MAKVGIISLGCPRNLVDSETILGLLKERGNEIVELQEAETAIVNTCSFIEDARIESIETILDLIELKKQGKLKRIIVAGCLTKRYNEKLVDELGEVDGFIGLPNFTYDPNLPKFPLTPPHYRYIKIQEGCGNRCSFCVIPRIKGPLRSRPIDSIMEEVRSLPKEVSEVNLVGQDITMYGLDLYKELKLTGLIENIAKLNKIKWIRLLYANPERMEDRLIEVMKEEPQVCKYLDLPLQHINDGILGRMNRNITKAEIISLIEKLRRRIPKLAIRTSLIVGFPGEKDKDFRELLDFLREAKFEKLGVFTYSREEDTEAAGFPDQVPEDVKQARFDEIMRIQQDISAKINQAFLGKELEILIDEQAEGESNLFLGRTQFDAPEVDGQVWVKAKTASPGKFLKVRITDTLEYDLVGEEV